MNIDNKIKLPARFEWVSIESCALWASERHLEETPAAASHRKLLFNIRVSMVRPACVY